MSLEQQGITTRSGGRYSHKVIRSVVMREAA